MREDVTGRDVNRHVRGRREVTYIVHRREVLHIVQRRWGFGERERGGRERGGREGGRDGERGREREGERNEGIARIADFTVLFDLKIRSIFSKVKEYQFINYIRGTQDNAPYV